MGAICQFREKQPTIVHVLRITRTPTFRIPKRDVYGREGDATIRRPQDLAPSGYVRAKEWLGKSILPLFFLLLVPWVPFFCGVQLRNDGWSRIVSLAG